MDEAHYEYVGEVNPNLICAICQTPFINPVTTSSCKHTFCRKCIEECLKHKSLCPVDRSQIDLSTLHDAGPVVKNMLEELEVICDSEGCGHKGQRGMMISHTNLCAKKVVKCQNAGCNTEVPRDTLVHHRAYECKERKMKCGTCSELVTLRLKSGHVHIPSPSLASGCTCANSVNKSHRWSCPDAEIPCDHAPMGCPAMIKRCDLATHLGNCFFEQVTPYMNSLKDEIKDLKTEHAKTIKALGVRMRACEAQVNLPRGVRETNQMVIGRLAERIRDATEGGAHGRPAVRVPPPGIPIPPPGWIAVPRLGRANIDAVETAMDEEMAAYTESDVPPAHIASLHRRLARGTGENSNTRSETSGANPAVRRGHMSSNIPDIPEGPGRRSTRPERRDTPSPSTSTLWQGIPLLENAEFMRRYGPRQLVETSNREGTSRTAMNNVQPVPDSDGDQSDDIANVDSRLGDSDWTPSRDAAHQAERDQAYADNERRILAHNERRVAEVRARDSEMARLRAELRSVRDDENLASPTRPRGRPAIEDLLRMPPDRPPPHLPTRTDGPAVRSFFSSTSFARSQDDTTPTANTGNDSLGSASLGRSDESFATTTTESTDETDDEPPRIRMNMDGSIFMRGLANSTDAHASVSGLSTQLDTSHASNVATDALSQTDSYVDGMTDHDDISINEREAFEAPQSLPTTYRAAVAAAPMDVPDMEDFSTVVRVVGHLLETTDRMERVQQAQALSGDLRLQEEVAELRSMVNVMRPHVLGGISISSPTTPRIPSFHSAMTNLNGSDSTTDSGTLDTHSQDHDQDQVSIRETIAFSPQHIDPDGDTPSEVSSVQSLISANHPIRRNRWGNGNGFGQPMGIPPELGDGGPTVRVVVHRPVEHAVPRQESNLRPRHSVLNRLMSRAPRSSRGSGVS